MNTKKKLYLLIVCLTLVCHAQGAIEKKNLEFGDPFVLLHEGTYYMYGTSDSDHGIKVYQSKNLQNWVGPVGRKQGFALVKDDVWGENRFWAPEVYYLNGRFYMFFSVEEHIAVATSPGPLGPFIQKIKAPLLESRGIDNHLFIDDDRRKYMYYVAFNKGNIIWKCELEDNLLSVKKDTIKKCFGVSQDWERSQKKPTGRITEGPFVLKHKGFYYLVYSANHFRNPDYGVGYATAKHPDGPWTKYEGNPIIHADKLLKGTGHCAFFKDKHGILRVVYHSHNNMTTIRPRIVHINACRFVSGSGDEPDILQVVGPVCTPQLIGHD